MTSRAQSSPPDGGWGWVIVGASFLNMILLTSSFFSFAVLFVELVQVFDVATSRMALLGSIQASMSFGFSAVSGALIHKFGNRPIAIMGFVLVSSGLALSSLVKDVAVLYLTYGIISGVGLSFGMSPTQVIVQQYFDKRRVLAGGFVICGMSVGSLVSSPIMRLLIDKYGWRGALLLHSGIVLHGIILSCAFRPLPVIHSTPIYKEPEKLQENGCNSQTINQNGGGTGLLSSEESRHPDKTTVIEPEPCCVGVYKKLFFGFFDCTLWREKEFVLFTLGTFCMCFGAMTFPQHQVNLAVHLGTDKHQAAFAPTVVGVFSLASRLLFSFVSNLPCVNRVLQYGVTCILMGCVLCGTFLAQNFTHVAILCASFGLCIGAIEAIKPSVLVDLIGVQRIAQAFGMFLMCTGFAIIIASPLADSPVLGVPVVDAERSPVNLDGTESYLKDRTGSYNIPFAVLGSVVIVGGMLVISIALMNRKQRGDQTADDEELPEVGNASPINKQLAKSIDRLNKSMSVSMASLH